jgi:hypothetical protein
MIVADMRFWTDATPWTGGMFNPLRQKKSYNVPRLLGAAGDTSF